MELIVRIANEYQPIITRLLGIDLNKAWPCILFSVLICELILCYNLAPINAAMLKKFGYRELHGLPVYSSRMLFKHFWLERYYWFFDFTLCVLGYGIAIAVLVCEFDYRNSDLLIAVLLVMAALRLWVKISLKIKIGNAFCKENKYITGMIFLPFVYYKKLAFSTEMPFFISNFDE